MRNSTNVGSSSGRKAASSACSRVQKLSKKVEEASTRDSSEVLGTSNGANSSSLTSGERSETLSFISSMKDGVLTAVFIVRKNPVKIAQEIYLFLEKDELIPLGSLNYTTTRPSILTFRTKNNKTQVFHEGSLITTTDLIDPPPFRLGPNVLASDLTLKQQPNTDMCHTAILRHPLAFDRDGCRSFSVNILSHAPSSSETLAVGVRFGSDLPAMSKAEFIDEVDDGNIVAWGFSGLVLVNGDLQEAQTVHPREVEQGDIIEVYIHNDLMKITLKNKRISQKISTNLIDSLAFPIFDLIGGCKAVQIRLEPLNVIPLIPIGRNVVSLGPNAVGYRAKSKPEARTAISGAPLDSPAFEFSVLHSQTDEQDSEGLTVGFAWNRAAQISFDPDLLSPDLILSDKLWLVGFDGEFYDGANFHLLVRSSDDYFHGRVFKKGDSVTVSIDDGHFVIRRNTLVMFKRTLVDSPEEGGAWWAVIDLMGGVSAVAAFSSESRVMVTEPTRLPPSEQSFDNKSSVIPELAPPESRPNLERSEANAKRLSYSRRIQPPNETQQINQSGQPLQTTEHLTPQATHRSSDSDTVEPASKSNTGLLSRIKSSVAARLPTKLGMFSSTNVQETKLKQSVHAANLGISQSFRFALAPLPETRTSSFVQTDKHPHVDSDDTPQSSVASSLPSDSEYVPPDEKRRG
jgi:hypothetical protein